jgi:imidazolonepropionase-like amidohydrolase
VAPGRVADLVLLDANPLESVANLHAIHAVVRANRYHARHDLQSFSGGTR